MKTAVLFLALCALTLAIACSPVNIKHDYDNEADFAALKTYNWVAKPTNATSNAQAALQSNSLMDKRIKESVDHYLAVKGYSTNADTPDFLVMHHLGAEDKINVTDWGYGYGRYGRWYGGRGVEVHQYQEGTLILDIIAAGSKQLVWRGFATATIDPHASLETRKRKLDEVIAKILAEFPPTTK